MNNRKLDKMINDAFRQRNDLRKDAFIDDSSYESISHMFKKPSIEVSFYFEEFPDDVSINRMIDSAFRE